MTFRLRMAGKKCHAIQTGHVTHAIHKGHAGYADHANNG